MGALFLFSVFVNCFDLAHVAEHSDGVLYGVDLGGLVCVVYYVHRSRRQCAGGGQRRLQGR